jgi:hypothetical protein
MLIILDLHQEVNHRSFCPGPGCRSFCPGPGCRSFPRVGGLKALWLRRSQVAISDVSVCKVTLFLPAMTRIAAFSNSSVSSLIHRRTSGIARPLAGNLPFRTRGRRGRRQRREPEDAGTEEERSRGEALPPAMHSSLAPSTLPPNVCDEKAVFTIFAQRFKVVQISLVQFFLELNSRSLPTSVDLPLLEKSSPRPSRDICYRGKRGGQGTGRTWGCTLYLSSLDNGHWAQRP